VAKRRVIKKQADKNRDIIAVCNHMEIWSPKLKKDVIYDIENNIHTYYVEIDEKEIDIVVENESGRKHLITDPKQTSTNKLLDLPDCSVN